MAGHKWTGVAGTRAAMPGVLPGVRAGACTWIVIPAETAGAEATCAGAATTGAGSRGKNRLIFTACSALATYCDGLSCGPYSGLRQGGGGPSRVGVLITCTVCPGGPSCGKDRRLQDGTCSGGGGASLVGVNMRFTV